MKKTKIRGIVKGVFDTLSDRDHYLVVRVLERMGISESMTSADKFLHFHLALATTIEEIRSVQAGRRNLSESDVERYKTLLGEV